MKIYDFNGKKNISGERIREARIKMHLSQKALAVRLKLEGVELERDCISRIEIGTRFVADYEIKMIAKTLNVSVLWLLGIEWALGMKQRAFLFLGEGPKFTFLIYALIYQKWRSKKPRFWGSFFV